MRFHVKLDTVVVTRQYTCAVQCRNSESKQHSIMATSCLQVVTYALLLDERRELLFRVAA
jgi:hypothetical protein